MTHCDAIKPGPAGYAPITWTYCTLALGHDGDHAGLEFGVGPLVVWRAR